MDQSQLLLYLREFKPVVHCIVSCVSANFVANCLTSIGSSPLVSHGESELEVFWKKTDATFVNLYTEPSVTRAMMDLIPAANSHPLVVDPAGVAVSKMRRSAVLGYLATGGVWILRGNGAEIKQLASFDGEETFKGVDSDGHSGEKAGLELAKKYQCPIWVSGHVDCLISPEGEVKKFQGGNPMMAQVSGIGCAATAILAAFLGARRDRKAVLDVASLVIRLVNRIGELSGDQKGPGSFAVTFIDNLKNLKGI